MNVIKSSTAKVLADFGYGDDDMALSDDDKAWIKKTVHDVVVGILADDTHPYVRDSVRDAWNDTSHPGAPVIAKAVVDALPPSSGGPAPDYTGTITLTPKG
jgi:N-acetylmuramic acid 6-phosphate (MurNAc-6-P) etherase